MTDQSHSIDKPPEQFAFTVAPADDGRRLDQVLAAAVPQFSRARLQAWVREGRVSMNGTAITKTREAVRSGADICLQTPALRNTDAPPAAENIPLDVVFEDEDVLVVNKPAGLTVHPGAGQAAGTMQNALLHHRPALEALPRAGIVHRLDKLTSGLLVVAATLEAHTALVRALAERDIGREYLALVWGEVIAGGTIDAPLGRDPRDRRRYVISQGGRQAVTHYRVAERLPKHTLLRVQLETGRTHQIRVHMQSRKWPLVGDPVYGRRGDPLRSLLPRQALHAWRLSFAHPRTGAELSFSQDPPADMQAVLEHLRDAPSS